MSLRAVAVEILFRGETRGPSFAYRSVAMRREVLWLGFWPLRPRLGGDAVGVGDGDGQGFAILNRFRLGGFQHQRQRLSQHGLQQLL